MPKELPTNETLEILFQDEGIIAIHKPSGLLVHKSPIDKHETRYAMKILRDQIGQWVYPVHRLDKPTSGVLLFTLNSELAATLGEQFEQQKVLKTYQAVVRGFVDTRGKIDHPLKEIAAFKSEQARVEQMEAKPACTDFERLQQYELPFPDGRFPTSRYSLVKLFPHSGRKHQIRRHLKHISHPIIGDVKYGKGPHNRTFRERFSCQRLLLASTQICFKHPITDQQMEISCPLAKEFTDTLRQLEPYYV